jgi:flagellar biosynthesis regulator FlaF
LALQGKLEDMPVVDVLQFIYASRRSGTLHLESRGRRGFVIFREGNIGQATTNAPENNLGHILVSKGLITEEDLGAAVARQRSEYTELPLGRVLGQMRLVSDEAIKAAVVEQIEAAVRDFVLWLDGDFVFELGTGAAPPDDIAVSVDGLLAGVNVDTQHLLLECIRIFDEKGREPEAKVEPAAAAARAEPAAEVTPPEEIEEPSPALHTVFLYSNNEPLFAFLNMIAGKKRVECRVFQSFTELMLAVESILQEDFLPVVVLDVDYGVKGQQGVRVERAADLLSKLKATSPATDVICVAARASYTLRLALLERRARAVISMPSPAFMREEPPPADVKNFMRELWIAIIESFRIYDRIHVKEQWRRRISSLESYLLKLKKFVREAQKSNFTFLVSLDLLNIISENYERALLLVIREGRAAGIGGFGDAHDGTPLGILAKSISIPLDEYSIFQTVAERKTTYRGRPDVKVPVHRDLFERIGKPYTGEVMIVPLISGGRTLAMIYCDNGDVDKPLVYDELLDLLSNQTNILYERMLAETIPKGLEA